jgi:hypothetical protein
VDFSFGNGPQLFLVFAHPSIATEFFWKLNGPPQIFLSLKSIFYSFEQFTLEGRIKFQMGSNPIPLA